MKDERVQNENPDIAVEENTSNAARQFFDNERLADADANFLGQNTNKVYWAFAVAIFLLIFIYFETPIKSKDTSLFIRMVVEALFSMALALFVFSESAVRKSISIISAIIVGVLGGYFIVGNILVIIVNAFTPIDDEATFLKLVGFGLTAWSMWVIISSTLESSAIFGTQCRVCGNRGGISDREVDRIRIGETTKVETYSEDTYRRDSDGHTLKSGSIQRQRLVPYNIYDVKMQETCDHCKSEAVWMERDEQRA
jgi:hypothetical protein